MAYALRKSFSSNNYYGKSLTSFFLILLFLKQRWQFFFFSFSGLTFKKIFLSNINLHNRFNLFNSHIFLIFNHNFFILPLVRSHIGHTPNCLSHLVSHICFRISHFFYPHLGHLEVMIKNGIVTKANIVLIFNKLLNRHICWDLVLGKHLNEV